MGQFSCLRAQGQPQPQPHQALASAPASPGATVQASAVWFAPGCRNIDRCQAAGGSAAQQGIFGRQLVISLQSSETVSFMVPASHKVENTT